MARRGGRKGNWLATDDLTGITCYASELKLDFWGNYTKKPLLRNLQEIATPLGDPYPVAFYTGPTYEKVDPCDLEVAPPTIGLTNIPTPNYPAIQIMGWNPGIGTMSVGCTLIVR